MNTFRQQYVNDIVATYKLDNNKDISLDNNKKQDMHNEILFLG